MDLVLVSKNLVKYVERLEIDSVQKYKLARTTVKNGKLGSTSTDHYPMIFKLKGIPLKQMTAERVEKEIVWNLRKEGGWEKYHEITEIKCDELVKVTSNNDESIEVIAEKFDKIHEKIKFASFGKTKRKKLQQGDKTLIDLVKKKTNTENVHEVEDIEEQINKRTMEVKSQKLSDEIKELKAGAGLQVSLNLYSQYRDQRNQTQKLMPFGIRQQKHWLPRKKIFLECLLSIVLMSLRRMNQQVVMRSNCW